MAEKASADEVAKIRGLATNPSRVKTTGTVHYDLMFLQLTKDDICTEIVDWIDADERIKRVTLHSFAGKVGNVAFELKPRINGSLVYVKVTIDVGTSGEEMLIVSAHRDH